MSLRFLIFIISFIFTVNAQAKTISSDDVSIMVEPLYKTSQKTGEIVNNFIVKLKLPKGWYTYYKNGGDAAKGADLYIKNLPSNIKKSELFYSTPEKHTSYGFTSYIYNKDALFNFQLLNNSKKELPQTDLKLDSKIEFLACKNICLPITKEFKITSKVSENSTPNVNYFINSKAFPATQETTFAIKENHLFIKLNNLENLESAIFIPNDEGFINDTATQEVIKVNNAAFLKIELDEYLEKTPTAFSGIIKANNSTYNIKAKPANLDVLTTFQKFNHLAVIALFALIGGIILNLMPCVLPVIGLKIFALLKHKSIKERLKGSLSYSAGVFASMMLIVGVLLILKHLGNDLAWGFQLQNKYFVYFMITLLMLIGLNLLGLFEIGSGISNKANKLNMKYSSDFFTGVLTTLVATPCTAPFMATSLGFALSSNSNAITFTIFAFLALGICLPILIIAIIPKAHKILPKPGAWSERLKQLLAFPIFATVVWLVWVLDSGNYIITLCLSGVFIASFIGWNLTLISKVKYLIIIITLTLSSLAIYNHTNKPEQALKFNKQTILDLNNQGKNIFVDFTAKWCLTCQYNKKTVLDLTQTRKLFNDNNTVFMIADWTLKDDLITKELEQLARSGVPVYAIYPADGSSPILLPEILTKNTLKEYIRKL